MNLFRVDNRHQFIHRFPRQFHVDHVATQFQLPAIAPDDGTPLRIYINGLKILPVFPPGEEIATPIKTL